MHPREFWQRYEAGERNFRGVDLSSATFEGELDSVDLSGSNLKRVEIRKCSFRNSNLENVDFQGAYLDESNFINVDFQNANFAEVTAVLVDFEQCRLIGANIIDAHLADVYFRETNLSQSKWEGTTWSGGIADSNLAQADLEGLAIGRVDLTETILPNGTSINHIWEDIVIEREPPEPEFLPSAQLVVPVELHSEVGIDYSRLRDLLAAKRWTEADRETARLMCKAVGCKFPYSTIETEEMVNFPCADLKTIDQLWVQSSWGRFGFSIQHRIWSSISDEYRYDRQIYQHFRSQIGWMENDSFLTVDNYTDEESIKQVAEGYLPLIGIWGYLGFVMFFGEDYVGEFSSIYHRMFSCNIQ
jgi:uncharacterized protein YjbI with pentapeptide repeats